MSLKDLYKNTKKPIKTTSLSGMKVEGLESYKALQALKLKNEKFTPRLDYTKPENFAIYGLAEEYYDQALKNIYNSYPYDGSEAERIMWEVSSSALEMYVYDNLYPKTNGYVNIGYGSSLSAEAAQDSYRQPASNEYIFFKGGPHTSSAPMAASPLYQNFSAANKLDTAENLKSNLSFTGVSGSTLEFWLKKPAFDSSQSDKQVIFDIAHSASFKASSYKRFRVEVVSGSSQDKFRFELMSGSNGSFYGEIGSGLDIDDNQWAHYALTFKNSGSNIRCSLYKNGTLNHTVTTGSSIGSFDGAIAGQVGSMYLQVSGAYAGRGWGLLSGSLDELRFWRKARTFEEIGRDWRSNVFGGTNTDRAKQPDLGLYYKFNEGVFNSSTTDSRDAKVLDYSGRISNGTWTGYAVGARSTDSAIVLASAASSEVKDPIIYSANSSVSALATSLQQTGSMYDNQNSTGLFRSFASWIQEDDQNNNLKNLCQIMASYLDTLYGQIYNVSRIGNLEYPERTEHAYSFMQQVLGSKGFEASDIFLDASVLETFRNRSEQIIFEGDVVKVKNSIFHNIYNNLEYLNKSKGTKKSLRNLLRCFGVDEELVKVNTYGNNTTYVLKDSIKETSKAKRFIDFMGQGRTDGVVYNGLDAADSNERSYLVGGSALAGDGATLEGSFLFPTRPSLLDNNLFSPSFRTNSLMGIKEASTSSPTSNAWVSGDNAEILVRSVRPNNVDNGVYFELTSSHFGISLTSSLFNDVYDNQRWTVAAKVYHEKHPVSHIAQTGTTGSYIVELCGYNADADILLNSFSVTASVTSSLGEQFFEAGKRVFAGAQRTNTTGSVVTYSDSLVSSVRYYNKVLDNEVVKTHAKEPFNLGAEDGLQNIRIASTGSVKGMSSLALAWEFNDVSGSDASGTFVTKDYSSGSYTNVVAFGSSSLAQSIFTKHPGLGYGFPANSSAVVSRQYLNAVEKDLPEVVDGAQLVRVLSADDRIFEREQEPEEFFSSIEMNSASPINQEILKYFSSMRDLNTAIGTPAEKYKTKYKDLGVLRRIFFERVENTPDAETYFEYFKWIDDAVNNMLFQFLPMSADVLENSLKTIESHVLERNKIVHRYPYFEYKLPVLEDQAYSLGATKRRWSVTHAPLTNSQSDNCTWWNTKAEKTKTSTGDATLDTARQNLFNAFAERDKNIDLQVVSFYSNDFQNQSTLIQERKMHDVSIAELKIGSGRYLTIEPSDVKLRQVCNDEVRKPTDKVKYDFNYEE